MTLFIDLDACPLTDAADGFGNGIHPATYPAMQDGIEHKPDPLILRHRLKEFSEVRRHRIYAILLAFFVLACNQQFSILARQIDSDSL